MRSRFLAVLLLALHPFAGFAQPTQEQPKLETLPLVVGDKKITAEVADEDSEREAGLMFRKKLADGDGMLFVFAGPQHVGFWMKNTILPLSIAYISHTGMILEIHDLQPGNETPVDSKFDTITYALEVPQGWFTKNSIPPGTMVGGLPQPSKQ